MGFERLSGEELEAALLRLRGRERRLEVQVLLGLAELDRRKLYLDWGYASLFAYCVERPGYCESSAGRRIAAARAMKRLPRIQDMRLSGEARLSTIAMAAGELERDGSVLEEIRGKTQREVQAVLARRGKVPRRPDRLQAVGDGWEFQFAAGQALREKFERARALLSRKHPEGVAYEQVFEAALDEYLKRHDPGRSRRPTPPGGVNGGRDSSRPLCGGRCGVGTGGDARIGAARGGAAGRRGTFEIDHVNLFCRGGAHREENLRLLCAAHNRREAERKLGRRRMKQFY